MHKEYHLDVNGSMLFIYHQENNPNRPTLIFLHDSLGCTALWRDFPTALGQMTNCNVLVYDRLGYGKSDPMPDVPRPVNYMEAEAEILYYLLNELSINQPILFGHSDGASIALLTAAKYPRAIKAVISEAAHVFVEDITLQGIREAMTAYRDTNLRERLEKYHGDNTDILFRAWTLTWTREDFRNWNIESFLPAISCPVLALQGYNDEFGSLAQVESIISNVSGHREKALIESCGHTPHKETPEAALSISADFINSLK